MKSLLAHQSNLPHIHLDFVAPYIVGLIALGLLAFVASHWARKNRP